MKKLLLVVAALALTSTGAMAAKLAPITNPPTAAQLDAFYAE